MTEPCDGSRMRSVVFGIVALAILLSSAHAQPRRTGTPFQRMDRNGDGRLSRTEFRGPANAFQRLDKNGDGFLTPAEMKEARTGTRGGSRQRPPNQKEGEAKTPPRKESHPAVSLVHVDTHNHLAGWVGSGSTSADFEKAAETALDAMDRLGIKTMLIMPTPQTVNQENRHSLDDLIPIVKKHPGRFALLGGGGTLNVMIQQAIRDGETSADLRKRFEDKALEILSKGALGFGEMTTEHLSMNRTHPYVSAPPDHPLFLLLADIAAMHAVPIDIHMEAVPEDMPLPSRLRAMPSNPETLRANIPAFERLLAHNPKAKIIWVHAGWDNTGRWTTALSDRLLGKYPNLYMSIRVVPRAIPSRPIDEQGKIKPEWLELIRKYPGRFLIGSDEFYLPHQGGKGHPSGGSGSTTVGFLSQLPKDIAAKVGHENAARIFRLGP